MAADDSQFRKHRPGSYLERNGFKADELSDTKTSPDLCAWRSLKLISSFKSSVKKQQRPTGEEMSDVVKVQWHNNNLLQPYEADRTRTIQPEEAVTVHTWESTWLSTNFYLFTPTLRTLWYLCIINSFKRPELRDDFLDLQWVSAVTVGISPHS